MPQGGSADHALGNAAQTYFSYLNIPLTVISGGRYGEGKEKRLN